MDYGTIISMFHPAASFRSRRHARQLMGRPQVSGVDNRMIIEEIIAEGFCTQALAVGASPIL